MKHFATMKEKINGKRNRIKWLVKGILYISIVPWKILMAILVGLSFLTWGFILVLFLIALSIIWLCLVPIELVLFLFTGLTGFILWPKTAIFWWLNFPISVINIDRVIENLFTVIERTIQK